MWSNTRMVVLTAICAALYAAILIPFKVVPLIPGITEFRPANAIPVVCSFLFGPAAAWGSALGNLIGDFFGGLGPGDLFGFLANLLYGLVPYAVWEAVTDAPPVPEGPLASLGLLLVMGVAAMLCATVVGWGLHLLGFHPFTVLGTVVLMNNLVVAVVLAPFLLAVLYPRVRRARLLYRDLLGPRRPLPRWRAALGATLVLVGTCTAFAAGELIAGGRWVAPWAAYETASRRLEVGLGLLPLLGLAIVGLALL
ncbi:MAG: QueT transporter family protein [Deltaproteobacteria bacterium]|nr:MAG: QueT transporter family protein [Deltaproteobacteria bacterium]